MSTVEKKPQIYEAIANVMKDVGIVGKNDSNDFDHYKYRGIDAVMNALNPAMIKNKVFAVPTVLEASREERVGKNGTQMMYSVLTVKYTFYAEDGSSVDSVVVGEAMDRSDKSTNKAMSAAFKYAAFQTFCIPTEEMIDSETESIEIGERSKEQPKKTSKSTKPAPKPEPQPAQNGPIQGYPSRAEMIDVCKEHFVGDNLQNLLAFYKAESIDKLGDAQLAVAYGKAMQSRTA